MRIKKLNLGGWGLEDAIGSFKIVLFQCENHNASEKVKTAVAAIWLFL